MSIGQVNSETKYLRNPIGQTGVRVSANGDQELYYIVSVRKNKGRPKFANIISLKEEDIVKDENGYLEAEASYANALERRKKEGKEHCKPEIIPIGDVDLLLDIEKNPFGWVNK